MIRTASAKLGLYAVLAGLAFVVAIVAGRPEIAALGAPFAVYLVVATRALADVPAVSVVLRLDAEQAVEGQELAGEIEIAAERSVASVELLLLLPSGVALVQGPRRVVLRLRRGERRTIALRLAAAHWGDYRLGEALVRVTDRFGLGAGDARVEASTPLRVHPQPERLRSLMRPWETQPHAGELVARVTGDGTEFADIRPFAAGDRVHRISWRTSARTGELHVNVAHPERNSDVVILLDSFSQARSLDGRTLDRAVRAADALARAHLARRDRVGLVDFGGTTRWLTPSMGATQQHRIAETLLSSAVARSDVAKGIDVLPPRSLPPQALVIALTPLLDDRTIAALLDLRARGFDLAIIEIPPIAGDQAAVDELDDLARRFWRLRRDALRLRFEQAGVGVARWGEGRPLTEAIEEVSRFRRYARRASA